jgi:stage III sporulation protein AB
MIGKIAGGILILAAGGYLGVVLSSAYRRRERGIAGLIYALRVMKTEIGFCESYVADIFHKLSARLSGEFSHLFARAESLAREGVKTAECVSRAIGEFADALCLRPEEIRIMEEFASQLGLSDRKQQLENIDKTILLLEEEKGRAHEETARSAKMRQTFCLLGAALTVVLLL